MFERTGKQALPKRERAQTGASRDPHSHSPLQQRPKNFWGQISSFWHSHMHLSDHALASYHFQDSRRRPSPSTHRHKSQGDQTGCTKTPHWRKKKYCQLTWERVFQGSSIRPVSHCHADIDSVEVSWSEVLTQACSVYNLCLHQLLLAPDGYVVALQQYHKLRSNHTEVANNNTYPVGCPQILLFTLKDTSQCCSTALKHERGENETVF